MKKVILALTLLLSVSLHAGTSVDEVDKEIKTLSDIFMKKTNLVIDVVKSKRLKTDARNDKIIQIVEPMFDFELMAKIALGKTQWQALTPEKKKEFLRRYVNRMKNSYSKKVDTYTDEKILLSKAFKHKTRITIETKLVGTTTVLDVNYKLYSPKKRKENKDLWLAYDVVIGGVSIIKTDRAQFKALLRTGDIDHLMSKMSN